MWLHSPTEFGGILPPVPSRYTPAERGILKQNTIVKMVDICDIKNRKCLFVMVSLVISDWYFFLGGGGWGEGGEFEGGTHGVLVVRRVTPELSFSFSETKIIAQYNRLL